MEVKEMESTTPAEATLDEKQMEAAINEMFQEMDRLDERIRRNQSETELLRIQTQAILKELKKVP
jgi:hypothetical protein